MKKWTKTLVSLVAIICLLCSMTSTAFAGVNAPGTLPIVDEPITLTIGVEYNATIEDWETNLQTLYMEEHSGIQLDFVVFPTGEMMTKLELMIAAGGADLPDILMGEFEQAKIMPWAEASMIIPLTQYYKDLYYWGDETLATSNAYHSIDEVLPYITSYDGEIYGVYHMNENNNTEVAGSRLNLYGPWLDKLGLELPKTTDDLYNVLKAFKEKDPNGNGIADEIPLTAYKDSLNWTRRFLMTPFQYMQDEYWTVEDGVIGVSFNTDGWREGLRYANKLCEEGLLDAAMFTQDQASLTVSCSQDPHIIGSYVRISTSNMSGDDLDRYEYWRLGYLTGPDGETRVSTGLTVPVIRGIITKNCENPEAAFMLMDWMNGKDLSIITRYGFEDMTYFKNDKEVEIAEQKVFWETYPTNYPEIFYNNDETNRRTYPVGEYKLEEGLWGTLQNVWWGQLGPNTMTPNLISTSSGAGALETEKGRANFVAEYRHTYMLDNAIALRDTSKVVTGLNYNEEELEVISDYYSEIKTYVEESWASFVTGALDIDDDATWNNYLKTLEAMNLAECIEATQSCYSRAHGAE